MSGLPIWTTNGPKRKFAVSGLSTPVFPHQRGRVSPSHRASMPSTRISIPFCKTNGKRFGTWMVDKALPVSSLQAALPRDRLDEVTYRVVATDEDRGTV
jgi:hypothetical protein